MRSPESWNAFQSTILFLKIVCCCSTWLTEKIKPMENSLTDTTHWLETYVGRPTNNTGKNTQVYITMFWSRLSYIVFVHPHELSLSSGFWCVLFQNVNTSVCILSVSFHINKAANNKLKLVVKCTCVLNRKPTPFHWQVNFIQERMYNSLNKKHPTSSTQRQI